MCGWLNPKQSRRCCSWGLQSRSGRLCSWARLHKQLDNLQWCFGQMLQLLEAQQETTHTGLDPQEHNQFQLALQAKRLSSQHFVGCNSIILIRVDLSAARTSMGGFGAQEQCRSHHSHSLHHGFQPHLSSPRAYFCQNHGCTHTSES